MKTLETQRLQLRSFCESDVDDFYNYCKNPNVGPNAGWKPHEDKEESMKILRGFIEAEDVWAIICKKEKRLIGSIGLHRNGRRSYECTKMIGYVLEEPSWGKGLMTEAVREVLRYGFEEEKLALISIFHFTFNDRSKRVIEKCGFQYEGTLRKSTQLPDGTIADSCAYSMTKEEYFTKNKE